MLLYHQKRSRAIVGLSLKSFETGLLLFLDFVTIQDSRDQLLRNAGGNQIPDDTTIAEIESRFPLIKNTRKISFSRGKIWLDGTVFENHKKKSHLAL